jgi:hypothetical protein
MTRRPAATASRVAPRPTAAALDVRRARGAILVHTAATLVGLMAFMAFIVDYGILWTARRQIQNAADVAALAAANSLAFDAPNDHGRARVSALTAVGRNQVWGGSPGVTDGDITFPACPAGAVGSGPCVRVEAFRNQAHGNPLPTVFGQLVNVNAQGVAATATAQVLYGHDTDCVRPMAIPDRWDERNPPPPPKPWTPLETFSAYGPPLPAIPDYYEPPGGGFFGPNGTGFSRGPSGGMTGGDHGLSVAYRPAQPPYQLETNPQSFLPVRIGGGGAGGFLNAMTGCESDTIGPGSIMELESSGVDAATLQAGAELIGQDPGAVWDSSLNGGHGGVVGGCMASADCPGPRGRTVSPRIIAIPAFNPDAWDSFPAGSNTSVQVTRIVGFFVDHLEPPRIAGRLMVYPVIPRSTMTAHPDSSFIVSVSLIR